ncbi:MAG: dihydropyrimidinase [Elusimicrobiota bacterium]
MRFDLLIKGGTVLSPKGKARADVGVLGGRVAALGANLSSAGASVVLDARGCMVLPGGVDAHTHMDLPYGRTTTADDFSTGTLAAAMGGTTTIIDFATQEKGRSLQGALDLWHEKADGRCFTDYAFHMAVTDITAKSLREFRRIIAQGLPSFKFYMAYPALMLGDKDLFKGFRRLAEEGGLAMVHAENGAMISSFLDQARAKRLRSPAWHPWAHPMLAEEEAAHRAAALAESAGVPLYIVHVTCSGALEAIRSARQRGLPVFGETCPQYLYLDDREYSRPGFEAAKFVLSPPLRPRSEQEKLWLGLRRGELQVVSTDHCSFNYRTGRGASKQLGCRDFTRIPNGVPGVETRMLLMWDAVARGRLSAGRFVELTASQPARIFGLAGRKGILVPGADADIVILDPRRKTRISAKTQFMNADYSAYEGRLVHGRIRDVFLRGRPLVLGGLPAGEGPQGAFLKRSF